MNLKQAKKQLNKFSGGQLLTFSVEHHPDGGWSAVCDQIPAVATCGEDSDVKKMESIMKDAILTAAGIDGSYANLLRDASAKKELALIA